MENELTNQELKEIKARCDASTKGPWQAFVEGRDHWGGSDFIRTGGLDDNSPDIELTGAKQKDYDFIANAKQDIPKLIAEIKRLRGVKVVGE